MIGRFDQIRKVSGEWIRRHRPDIIQDSALIDGFDPVVIVDLKTNYLNFDIRQFKENVSLEQAIRWQYQWHGRLQAIFYTFLYEMNTGNKPVAFLWYYLRSGKWFPTYIHDYHYKELNNKIRHVINNINDFSFPRNEGTQCYTCEFLELCNEDHNFILASPEEVEGFDKGMVSVSSSVKKKAGRQLRFAFGKTRKKREVLPLPSSIKETHMTILGSVPWDEDGSFESLIPLKNNKEK